MGAEIDSLEIVVESSASEANKQLDRLAKKLESVSASLGKFNTRSFDRLARSMSGANSATQKTVQSTNNLKKFSNALDSLAVKSNKAGKSLSSFAQISGKFYANAFLLVRGIKKLWGGIGSSMDYVETFNYWNVTLDKIGKEFGDQFSDYGYDSAEAYAESFRGRLKNLTAKMTGYHIGDAGDLTLTSGKSLGLDPEQMMNYQAKILAVTNSVGLLGETSTNVAKALSMLSADMSSFTNTNLSTVMTNFQSGLIGQSRALYKYGIDITNATLQTYAYKNGITKAMSEMTQAEKMQLRMLAILDQSKVAWGDQANTLNSVANQYRIFGQQLKNLSRTLGNLFLPIVKSVLPVVNGLIIALNKLFTTLGFKSFGDNWLKDLQDGISPGFDNSGLDDMADSADDTKDSLDEANEAAKKLKGTLGSFDKLNAISMSAGSDSGNDKNGDTGTIDLTDAIGSALSDYESVWNKAFADSQNKAQEYADTITAVFENMWSAIEHVRNAISNLWDNGLSKLANFTWTALKDFYENFLVPVGEWAFGKDDSGLTRLVNVINDGLMAIDWETLNTSLKNFWIAIEPYAEQFGEGLIDFFEDLTGIAVDVINNIFGKGGAAQSITDWLNNNDPEKARSWGYAIGVLATAIGGLKIVSSVLSGIATFIKLIKDSTLVKIISSIASGIGKLVTAIGILKSGGLLESTGLFSKLVNAIALTARGTKTLHNAFVSMFGAIGTAVAGIGSIISGAVLAVTNFFSMWENGWNVLGEILKDLGIALAAVGAVILGVAATTAAIVAAVVAAVSTIAILVHDNWDAICDWFSGAAEWFNTNVITPIVDFFKGLWESVSGFFSGLWEDICEIWTNVSGWFSETVIEPVVSLFQGFWTRVKQIFEGLWIIIQAVWIVVSGWFKDHLIDPIITLFTNLKKSVKNVFNTLKKAVFKIWGSVSEWFQTRIADPIVSAFNTVKTKVHNAFYALKVSVITVWEKVSGWFTKNVTTPVKKAFKTMVDSVKGFFDGLWKSIKGGVVGAMNAVIGGIEKAINWIVSGINKIIGGFNKVVSWAAKVAEVDWGGVDLVPKVSLGRISAYYTGGFPEDGLFMANHGELVGQFSNGKTAVVNNKQIIQGVSIGVADAVSKVLSPYLQSGQRVNVVLAGDAGRFLSVVHEEENKQKIRTGKYGPTR